MAYAEGIDGSVLATLCEEPGPWQMDELERDHGEPVAGQGRGVPAQGPRTRPADEGRLRRRLGGGALCRRGQQGAGMTVAERLALNLKQAREAIGLSQEEIAWRAQIHWTSVSLLENGHQVPRLLTLVKLASACDATPNDLLAGIEWTPPPMGNFGGLSVKEDV